MYTKEGEFTLQVLLDRGLKMFIKRTSDSLKQRAECKVRPLTLIESNSIRYMAGYIAVKLLKKYRRSYKNNKIQQKHKLFVHTLEK